MSPYVQPEGEMRHVKDVARIDRMWMCPECRNKITVGDWYEKIDGQEYHTLVRRKTGTSCADEKHDRDRRVKAKKRREAKVAREMKHAERMKEQTKRRKALLLDAFGVRISERAFDRFGESCRTIGIHKDECTAIWNDQNDLRDRFKDQVVDELLKVVDGVLPVKE